MLGDRMGVCFITNALRVMSFAIGLTDGQSLRCRRARIVRTFLVVFSFIHSKISFSYFWTTIALDSQHLLLNSF